MEMNNMTKKPGQNRKSFLVAGCAVFLAILLLFGGAFDVLAEGAPSSGSDVTATEVVSASEQQEAQGDGQQASSVPQSSESGQPQSEPTSEPASSEVEGAYQRQGRSPAAASGGLSVTFSGQPVDSGTPFTYTAAEAYTTRTVVVSFDFPIEATDKKLVVELDHQAELVTAVGFSGNNWTANGIGGEMADMVASGSIVSTADGAYLGGTSAKTRKTITYNFVDGAQNSGATGLEFTVRVPAKYLAGGKGQTRDFEDWITFELTCDKGNDEEVLGRESISLAVSALANQINGYNSSERVDIGTAQTFGISGHYLTGAGQTIAHTFFQELTATFLVPAAMTLDISNATGPSGATTTVTLEERDGKTYLVVNIKNFTTNTAERITIVKGLAGTLNSLAIPGNGYKVSGSSLTFIDYRGVPGTGVFAGSAGYTLIARAPYNNLFTAAVSNQTWHPQPSDNANEVLAGIKLTGDANGPIDSQKVEIEFKNSPEVPVDVRHVDFGGLPHQGGSVQVDMLGDGTDIQTFPVAVGATNVNINAGGSLVGENARIVALTLEGANLAASGTATIQAYGRYVGSAVPADVGAYQICRAVVTDMTENSTLTRTSAWGTLNLRNDGKITVAGEGSASWNIPSALVSGSGNNTTGYLAGSTVRIGNNVKSSFRYYFTGSNGLRSFNGVRIYIRTMPHTAIDPNSISVREYNTATTFAHVLEETRTDADGNLVYVIRVDNTKNTRTGGNGTANFSLYYRFTVLNSVPVPTATYQDKDYLFFEPLFAIDTAKWGTPTNSGLTDPFGVTGHNRQVLANGGYSSNVKLRAAPELIALADSKTDSTSWTTYNATSGAGQLTLNTSTDTEAQLRFTITNNTGRDLSDGFTVLLPIPKAGANTGDAGVQSAAFGWNAMPAGQPTGSVVDDGSGNAGGSLAANYSYAAQQSDGVYGGYALLGDAQPSAGVGWQNWGSIAPEDIWTVLIACPDAMAAGAVYEFVITLALPEDATQQAGQVNTWAARIYKSVQNAGLYINSERFSILLSTGGISGRVMLDMDGTESDSSIGVPGVVVNLYKYDAAKPDGKGDFVKDTATGADGSFLFSDLQGDYVVEMVLPDGQTHTVANVGDYDMDRYKFSASDGRAVVLGGAFSANLGGSDSANAWVLPQHIATFDYNGGEGPSGMTEDVEGYYPQEIVACAADPQQLPQSTRFDGRWNTAPDGTGTDFVPGATLTAHQTWYAVYVQLVTVIYDANGGAAVNPGSATLDKGKTVGSLPAAPTRDGYTFAGWNTQQNGSGSVFTAQTVVNADITVYAQWRKVQPPDPVSSSSMASSSSAPVSSSSSASSSSGGQSGFEWGTETSQPPPPGSNPTSGSLSDGTVLPTGQTGNPFVDIVNGNVPLFGRGGSVWSLLNLLMAFGALIMALVLFVRGFGKRQASEEEETEAAEEEREEERERRWSLPRLLAVLGGLLPGVLFLILENMRQPMVWINHNTLVIGLVFLLSVALAVLQAIHERKKQNDLNNDDEEYKYDPHALGVKTE